ncbi:MAG: nucleotidyltransferase domain-containing protein [Chlamydiae bacterium]|nr:nucleotidyltransferase domain-containing protein [Chlamydiota bacterium]MBI3266974.1 nucleotidyltransferase domain-containing protein [Chlamydiota bacterium]
MKSLPYQKYRKNILNIIFKKIKKEECVVFLFGSHAVGNAISSSDMDIGILCRYDIKPKDFLEVEEELNNNIATLRKIDFVDFRTLDEKVREEASQEIELWHTGKNCRDLIKPLKRRSQN